MDRFTQLPPFTSENAVATQGNSIPWAWDGPALSSQIYISSWANLLFALTADESPVFMVNGRPVKADLSSKTYHPATLDAGTEVSESYTELWMADGHGDHQLQPGSCALSFVLNGVSGEGTLHSFSATPLSFLHQIGKQLKQIVCKQAQTDGIKLDLSSDEVPDLSISNPVPRILPGPQLLHELALGGSKASKKAIDFLSADGETRSLSYETLDRLSSKLAAKVTRALAPFQEQLPQNVVIPVLLPQSLDLYISCLAILKAGAAFCPLNTDTPPERISFILRDVAANVVVTQRSLASKVPDDAALIVITTDDFEIEDSIEELSLVRKCDASHLAYVMYTSGSTGRPKGVGISHLAATQSLLAHDELIPQFRRFLQFASPTFDVSVFEWFFPLMRGATVVGCDRELMLRDISHVMRKMDVDGAELTPTVAGELLRKRSAAPALRVLLTIGEMLTRRVVDEFGGSTNAAGILYGMYGPTEAAIHCTAASNFTASARVNLIGRPFSTVSSFIVSLEPEHNLLGQEPHILPVGHIGELVVGGPQLTQGYINRPEENAKAFLHSATYGRLYRTGDKARMLPSGELECFGRISSGQVKLRGQRIELGEIEHAVCMVPDVRSAVVIVADGNLVAFILASGNKITDEELRKTCRRWLPRFMVPGEFILVDSFPKLPSGKIDRKLMESQCLQQRQAAQIPDQHTSRDAIEEAIFASVSRVLQSSTRRSTESLAASGLDSLRAIRLAADLRDAGVNIGVGTILECDSVDAIWRHIGSSRHSQDRAEFDDVDLQKISQPIIEATLIKLDTIGLGQEVDGAGPCSDIQQAMIVETVRHSRAYCNWIELEFEPHIDIAAVKESLRLIAQQNHLLRCGFVEIGLRGHSYSQFSWKELRDNIFEQSEDFAYDLALGDQHGMLNPLRIQYSVQNDRLRLLVHIHHALYDGWSWDLILNDLQSVLEGQGATSRPSYKTVTDYLLKYQPRSSASDSLLFWRDQLSGMSPSTWPSFHPRYDVPAGSGESTRVLDVSTAQIDQLTHQLRISRQAIFQAAFCYLLSSYVGASDVVFGTVFSGRTLPLQGIESIIGPCIRVLPSRMDLERVQSVTDLLLAIHNMNRKYLEQGTIPLRDIKKASGIDPGLSLFDSAIVWQETIYSGHPQTAPFKQIAAADFLEYALLLELEPKEGGIKAKATYQKSILPAAQVDMFLEQIDHVVSAIVHSTDLLIKDIPRHLPNSALSIENENFESQHNLPSLAANIEVLAAIDPDRVAVEFLLSQDPEVGTMTTESITYKELNVRANRMAHYLVQLGTRPHDLVGILLDKSIDLYVSILAVLKTGAGYVPLTPRTPTQRVHTILVESNSRVCITDSQSEQEHDLCALKSLQSIDLTTHSFDDYSHHDLPAVTDGSSIAYAVFTSGSTGTPKGVLVKHHNIQSNIAVLMDLYPTPSGSKLLQACSHAFDVSVFEILFAWHAGMTLCSTTNDILFRDIELVIRDLGITHLSLTPTVASLINPEEVPGVQFLVTAGEALTTKVHHDWAGKGLYQGYGPCETTNICTVMTDVKASTQINNIGPPLKNTSAFVVTDDTDFCLTPRGAIGELCFGGDQVAQGYLNMPDLTAAKFVEHHTYGRLYRSGDYGRMLPDGSISIIGRRDDQVKLRGQRIELGEINSVLLQSHTVQDCASMILEAGPRKQQQLVSIWVPSASLKLTETSVLRSAIHTLHEKLVSMLPIYMIPSLLIPVDSLPLTDNGKTDKRKLQEHLQKIAFEDLHLFSPNLQDEEGDEGFSELEQTIATIISSVTGAEFYSIRRHTSFYNLGLDSISAISVSRQLRESGLGQVDVSMILRHSSVARLSKAIQENSAKGHKRDTAAVQISQVFDAEFVAQTQEYFKPLGRTARSIYPCTPLQEAMLSVEASKSTSAYFNHTLFTIKGDHERHQKTWSQIAERHQIFRTYFKATNNPRFAYAQVLMESISLPWASLEVSPEDLNEEVAKAKSRFEAAYQLGDSLPYSLTLFTDPKSEKSFLLLSMHHAMYDGEALGQLLDEVQLALSGSPLPEPVTFDSFIEYMLQVDAKEQEGYWDNYLFEMTQTLVGGRKINNDAAEDGKSHQSYAKLDLSYTFFKERCRELSVAPLNVFHAAWARLLSIYTDSNDVCFGNVFSCRTIPLEGADRIVGPCFNTLPVRLALPTGGTNEDLMKAAQKSNNNTIPHQLSSLRHIQSRVLGDGSQLFDTMVILQTRAHNLDDKIWEMTSEEGNMDFPLICEIIPGDNGDSVKICLHSQNSCISPQDAELAAQQFAAIISQTLKYPYAQASDRRALGSALPSLPDKVSRKAKKFEVLGSATAADVRPWTLQEEEIRDILGDFAKANRTSISQSTTIFQLGLDSINAVQLSSKLRNRGYEISAGSILEAASVTEIAKLLESPRNEIEIKNFDFDTFASQHLHATCKELQIAEETVEYLRPCTPVQNGMLATFSNTNGDLYFNHTTMKSQSPLNKNALKEAWQKVMAKHEMLRTGFVQLKNEKYPFAMITYRQTMAKLPWYEGTNIETTRTFFPSGVDMLKELHQVPWSLTVEHFDTATVVRFSALHALYDAQSMQQIFADVAAAYAGEALGDAPSINSTLGPILVESSLEDESLNFWTKIAKEVQPTRFPDLQPERVEKKELLVKSRVCTSSLKILEDGCQELGVTLQAAAEASWARVLSAYTGEPNVCFGVVFSGRNLSPAAQNAAFPCLVTVPAPCRVSGTNREFLHEVLKRNSMLMKHQFTPLSKIQRWLKSEEGLFDTLFVYQKFASHENNTDFWRIVDEDASIDYPVSIELVPNAAELEFRLTHRSDVVPDEHAKIILEQFDALLKNSILSPDSNCSNYSSLGDRLLSVTPANEKSLPSTVTLLHSFVEEKAAAIPSKIAFEFASEITEEGIQKQTWTYRELNNDGNRIARLLQNRGATPGSLIAICFDKCPEASLGILGVLKTGCAYVAIDPNAPIARKQFILEDSGAKVLLCTSGGRAALGELSNVDLIALDEPGLLEDISCAPLVLAREIRPDDTCYCLYTSGTTGTPKGCEITHDNAVQAMLAFQRLFAGHWDEESRWLQFASFHFDVSVLEQYWSWSVGICVTMCPRDLLFEDLPGTINRLQITHIDLTPSLARLVFPDEVPSLCRGVFITGGEALKQEILDAWGKHEVIYNGYGPTEVTIGCTMLPRVPVNGKPSNIGPQFDNVGSYVFAPGTCTPVIRGGVGELCVSGALVGRGYLNCAELTKERFQYLSEYDERIYRTGDLVRILHNGCFQFLGRIDDQVKLRGQRLEIGEINEVIKHATSELGEISTLVIKHPMQSKEQLVSFVTRNSGGKKSRSIEVRFSQDDHTFLSQVKDACHNSLPGYMVPTHIIPMTALPLSPNNKIDNKVLKAIYEQLSLEEIQNLTALTAKASRDSDEEKKIRSVLAKFIETEESEIQPWSSIYELGLDSISVISFTRRLKDAGFHQAHPAMIMKNPTVSGLASALEQFKAPLISRTSLTKNARQTMDAFSHRHAHAVVESIGVSAADIEAIAPCTPLQEGIIYQFLNSSEAPYCSSFVFNLQPHVDFARLERAWSQTQVEVDMLRVRLAATPDGYAQIFMRKNELPCSQMTVSSDEEAEEVRQQRFKTWICSLDNLSKNLWEVCLVKSPSGSLMYLNIFHALYDGNSFALLMEKVARNYLGEISPGTPTSFLEALPAGPLCKDPLAEKFWMDHLGDARREALPKSKSSSHPAFTQKIDINGTECLDNLRKVLNVTEQAILHACWLRTLHHQYGFVPTIGIVVSGRALDLAGVEEVIGPLFNTIPSNVNFRRLKTWSDVIQRCHDYHTSTLPYQHTPLRDIMKWTKRIPTEPLFDSLFVFQRSANDREPRSRELWEEAYTEANHEYPLAFEVSRNGHSSLTATIAVQDHVMSTETAQEILLNFEKQLHALSQDPAMELPEASESDVSETVTLKNEVQTAEDESNFHWTPEAYIIRDAIAGLAGDEKQSLSPRTSIFEVGLDSIDAIKLSSRLSKSGIRLTVSMIMRYQTIEKMSEHLATTNGTSQKDPHATLTQLEDALRQFMEKETDIANDWDRILPATPLQEAMMAEMVASNYKNYYNHDVLELEPHVDVERMRDAWNAVVKAHPILRTSFVEIWDPKIPVSYAQIVHRESDLDIQTFDLNEKPVEAIIEEHRLRAASKQAPQPLLTVSIAVDSDRRYLILSIAHSLYDGWSINLLHEDVAKCYSGEHCQRPGYDGILNSILASSGDGAAKFWRALLANSVPTSFPKGQFAGDDQSIVYRMERSLSVSNRAAEKFCKRNGLTMQALCVSCWALALAGYVKKLDVVFGLVFSGRNLIDSESVMFPTMNTVAMRAILHGSRLEMVRYIQSTLVDMSEHQHFPLRKARPDIGAGQLFNTLFIYQKRPVEVGSSAPALYKSTGGSSATDYPVCVEIESVAQDVVCRVAGRDDVLGERDTEEILSRMDEVLSRVVQVPNEQTIEFVDGGMRICGGVSFQEVSLNGTMEEKREALSPRLTEWSSVESQIRAVLAAVSGVSEEQITKEATLFHLGLDSISAIKVAALLKKRAVRLTVSDMLKAGTIVGMAQLASQTQIETASGDLGMTLEKSLEEIDITALLTANGIESEQVDTVFPATSGQIYFLAMNALNPQSFYPNFNYVANQVLQPDLLNDAWDGLRQLPILRTAFLRTDDERVPFVQAILKTVDSPIVWHDEVHQFTTSPAAQRSIGSVPLTLHACQTSRGTALKLHIHHALYDAVSLPRLVDALATLCDNRDASLPSDHADLRRYVAFEKTHSPVDIRRQFWENYLGKAGDNESPMPGSSIPFGAIESYYHPGLIANMSRVEEAARRENVSVQAIVLAVYIRVHAQLSGKGSSGRAVIGLYLANRSHSMEGLPDLMAPTLNIVPLRIDDKHGNDLSVFAAAQQIQKELNDISRVEHAGVSAVELAGWTGVTVDACVNFLRFPEMPQAGDDETGGNQGVRFASVTAQEATLLVGQEEARAPPAAPSPDAQESDRNAGQDGGNPMKPLQDVFKVSTTLGARS
ncbi:nonribosomal siderophore peptide synthase SidC [Aspergillus clavatus NRRL 1]|uniref:Nonribosomal peptide synthetase sidC n=1 Tax=Aspergillus clavatus (strain ATCC 1007 / CBS 513.65 / DSM 816 / NCTC 3887 / NRRL 1 / QM 1276 / 107) TaxID=344612 RepID=A1CSJ8_ASPCL|nr:nonribosomal siderophore peptide synthase, putative [Aspergillus clavatus NRRL 1]EAW06285.1 nonribosomal siderophore peptide synthase, putative [Aspergillus clavatus NRRL 1]